MRPTPPVVTMTFTPRCCPKVLHTCDVCKASSRVGTNIKACVFWFLGSTLSSVGMMKAAVLPVPFFARASMSRPVRATGIVASWMGEGLSNPAAWMPLRRSRLRRKSSKSRPFVFVTSYHTVQLGHCKKIVPLCTSVCGRVSLLMLRGVSFTIFSEGLSLGPRH